MREYKPIIIMLIKFFAVYLILVFLYDLYLSYYQETLQTCDPYTTHVATQTAKILRWIGFDSEAVHYLQRNYMTILIDGKRISIVNEGCNALSVNILFVAFIIAFSVGFKRTFLFTLAGLIVLYIANLVRIVFINYIFYEHRHYGKTVHDYIFPAIIWGMVVVLWLVWIKFFALKRK
ncbi:MAG: exosortase family protein XrtF [Flavobacteriaceae bacterium]|jgi:exosortase family protein XrtF|nr:exosortase family protein XrtF [Flavobacteriaceae bacterium]